MSHQLDFSIVRIFIDGSVNPAGLGFVISDRLFATCSHVVKRAKGFTEYPDEKQKIFVYVDFPLIAPEQLIKAHLYNWKPPQPDGSGDFAILELDKAEIPDQVKPGKITWGADLWGHPCHSYGFPFPRTSDPAEYKKYKSGVWATGRILASVATGWYQIEDVKETGYFVQQGFSGGPVWDDNLDAVVGLVGLVEKAREDKVAFFLPIHALIKTFPFLIDKVNSVSPLSYEPSIRLNTFLTQHPDVSLWLQWVFATTIGWVLGIFHGLFQAYCWLCGLPIIVIVQWLALKRSVFHAGRWAILSTCLLVLIGVLSLNLGGALFWSTLGLTMGIAQWLVLRSYFPKIDWWLFATALGWLVAYALYRILWTLPHVIERGISESTPIAPHILVVMGGIAASVIQWYILRRHVARAFWWIFANSIYWMIAALFNFLISNPLADFLSVLKETGGKNPDLFWKAFIPVVPIFVIGVANIGTLLGFITGFS